MGSPKFDTTYKIAFTSALAASLQISATSCLVSKISGRIDSTATSATYYIQLCKASSLPADGAVTFLMAPIKKIHTLGIDTEFDIDFSQGDVKSKDGLFLVISTTEFTKTIIGSNWLSCTALYKGSPKSIIG